MKLSRKRIAEVDGSRVQVPPASNFSLPERVLQFGAGVLLRGLCDYFIDQANRQGQFNGRIVVVKSTGGPGDGSSFGDQDNLYTQCIRGVEAGVSKEQNIINASISRVLSAKTDWQHILACASNPDLAVVISNTTEVGLTLVEDDIQANPPQSFPGKLLAFLLRRYEVFKSTRAGGLVIIPTELIPNNGPVLLSILLELSLRHRLAADFTDWLQQSNAFCSSLVDRIVPGKLGEDQQRLVEQSLGYQDDLMIVSEYYRLWAIETSSQKVMETLSFRAADPGVVLAPDIHIYRELKLRLLNGPHTFCCGLAYLAGFTTVKQAMADPEFSVFIENLMIREIVPSITAGALSRDMALRFGAQVLDRFRNPYIEHPWINITLQYSSKMRMRNVPLISRYSQSRGRAPEFMCWGFAAYLLFMRSQEGSDGLYYGQSLSSRYRVNDDQAPWFCDQWSRYAKTDLVSRVLSRMELWGTDLSSVPGMVQSVQEKLTFLMLEGPARAIRQANEHPVAELDRET
jgi:tagaturonate reductase